MGAGPCRRRLRVVLNAFAMPERPRGARGLGTRFEGVSPRRVVGVAARTRAACEAGRTAGDTIP
jgi:hypothetical protein